MIMKNSFILFAFSLFLFCACSITNKIDREVVVSRNNPNVVSFDSLSSLSVGNGEFAFTVDATGLQTFPEIYKNGVPLGTQSQWGWHSFANDGDYKFEETLEEYDFGHGHKELYSTQVKEPEHAVKAADWFRVNPHRLHLGIVGLELNDNVTKEDIKNIEQNLDMYNGIISSNFNINNTSYNVQTVCHPELDMISSMIKTKGDDKPSVKFRFPYPTGAHCDDACDWDKDSLHDTYIVEDNSDSEKSVILAHKIDTTVYYVKIQWNGKGIIEKKDANYFVLRSDDNELDFSCSFSIESPKYSLPFFTETAKSSANKWNNYWNKGGIVDFSKCTDERAKELERRVVLSQYLMAIQCAGSTPPQETGLTYNSWFGKFHLEMIWWHQTQFALWGHPEMIEKTLPWYEKAAPMARNIAQRQGFKGLRWMKMTDPSSVEAPSKVGSFLIWQQPHYIYLAELAYRNNPSKETLQKYGELVNETAEFMADYATLDSINNRYVLKGCIPAQETLRASETVNPPFELSYWHFGLSTAQKWLEREGKPRNNHWDEIINKLSPLAANSDSLYLAAETAVDTYKDIRFTSDHMAVLGAMGILPCNSLINVNLMKNTFDWIWDNWNWNKTWGWDYPMTAMNAARMGEPEKAVSALLMNKRTNTYLVNGHNYQDDRLRVYLPGNGGLLTAVAMMCAGWDGCKEKNPGFPKDGRWDVKWEGLTAMP